MLSEEPKIDSFTSEDLARGIQTVLAIVGALTLICLTGRLALDIQDQLVTFRALFNPLMGCLGLIVVITISSSCYAESRRHRERCRHDEISRLVVLDKELRTLRETNKRLSSQIIKRKKQPKVPVEDTSTPKDPEGRFGALIK